MTSLTYFATALLQDGLKSHLLRFLPPVSQTQFVGCRNVAAKSTTALYLFSVTTCLNLQQPNLWNKRLDSWVLRFAIRFSTHLQQRCNLSFPFFARFHSTIALQLLPL